jgi:hypothetical protein
MWNKSSETKEKRPFERRIVPVVVACGHVQVRDSIYNPKT